MTKYLRNSTHTGFTNNGTAISATKYDETLVDIFEESATRVASMQGLLFASNPSDLVDGKCYVVQNFYSDTEGGGDPWFWDSSGNKNTHNGINTVDPTHSTTPGQPGWWTSENTGTTGVFIRIEKGFIDIKDAGAIADGSTDNATAIENAISTANSDGIDVKISAGSYDSSKITLSSLSDINIRGERGAVITCVDSGENVLFDISSSSNVTLGGFKVLAAGDTAPATSFRRGVITFTTVTDYEISDIFINNPLRHGVIVETNSNSGIIQNVIVDDILNRGIMVHSSNDVVVNKCICKDSPNQGDGEHCFDASNATSSKEARVIFSDCIANNVNGACFQATFSNYVSFDNNMINNTGINGIKLDNSNYASITSNTIKRMGYGVFFQNSEGATITGNFFDMQSDSDYTANTPSTSAIRGPVNKSSVQGNYFVGATTVGNAINLESTTNASVNNNYFDGFNNSIFLGNSETCSNVSICANTFRNCDGYSLRFLSSIDDSKIDENIIQGNAASVGHAVVFNVSTDGCSFNGNIVNDNNGAGSVLSNGTLTNFTVTGNHLTDVSPFSDSSNIVRANHGVVRYGYGAVTDTTDGNGEILIPHGLDTTPSLGLVNVEGDNAYDAIVVSRDGTNLKVRIRNSTDNSDITSTSVTVTWEARI